MTALITVGLCAFVAGCTFGAIVMAVCQAAAADAFMRDGQ